MSWIIDGKKVLLVSIFTDTPIGAGTPLSLVISGVALGVKLYGIAKKGEAIFED